MIDQFVNADMFKARYADVYKGDAHWQAVDVSGGATYAWDAGSTYIQNPPYFEGMSMTAAGLTDIVGRARWPCSATRSPPITFRPRAASRPTARPEPT
jgi:aconitase A